MKKLFTLFVAFLALAISAKAQVSDDFESYSAFTVDPTGTWTYYDGDGLSTYGITNVSFTNAYYTGSCIVFNPTQTSPDCSANYPAHSGSQYIIIFNGVPDDETGVSATNDWIISPALSLSGTATLSFYAREIVSTYGPEVMKIWYSTTTNSPSAFTLLQTESVSATDWTLYSYAIPQNATYVAINCNSDDVFGLMIDDISIMQAPTTPTIVCGASSLDFGTVLIGQSSDRTAQVTAYNLTAGITATTAAPFSVSADGNTYGTTATVAQTGGTLYVKYAPTAAGTSSDIVVLSSTGAGNDTIVLTGNGLDCSNTSIPYSTDFTNTQLNECWTVFDANSDGYTFALSPSSAYAYYHYNSSSDADDYLISPLFNFTGTQSLIFDYKAGLSSYPEILEVFAIGTDTVRLTQPETVSSTSYITKTIDLSNLSGDYSIAFHCISEEDQYYLYITNFQIIDASSAIVTIDADTFDYGTIAAGTTLNGYFNISTTNLNEAITVSTSAPFEVSLNDTTYNTTLTVPADTTFITSTRVYVRFAPTIAGTFNEMVLVTTTTTADTLIVIGNAVECDAITTFPFVETFDATSTTRPCWEIVDNNNDGNTFLFGTVNGDWVAAYPYHSTNAGDDYLISPEITLTSGLYGHIDYAVRSSSYPEKMSVYVIPENGTLANAVNIVPTLTVNNAYTDGFETLNFDLSAYTNQTIRIAIKAESDANMYYLFVDNFTIESLPDASMSVNPTSMSFNGMTNTPTAAQTATVSGTSLTNDINVTVTGPFEVSTNGTSFAATATIAQGSIINAPLYVRMNATTVGAQNGTVTLTSGSITATITLSGNAIECNDVASLPFNEDFEGGMFPPTCWNLISLNENTWEGHTDDGGNNWAYVNYAQTLQDEKLITKSINFSNETNVTLTFDFMASYTYITSTDVNEQYNLIIYASTDNGNTFSSTPVYNMRDDQGVFTSWEQTTATVDLSSLAGQPNVQLMFNYYGTYGAELHIDNIHIEGGVGINDNDNDNNVSIYPNPANNVINVNASSNINTVEVFNMMGQKVAAFDANNTTANINVSALANGIYTMRITTENGVYNQKITVAR